MLELDCEESWVLKNWCFWTVVLEKTLVSPLDCKEIQPVHTKRDQSWVFIGRTDVESESPILWPPGSKSWLIWKDPDPGRDWGQEKKGTTEDEMAGWHHWLDGHEFGWTPGVGDGQGGLACCHKVRHDWATELNWTEQYHSTSHVQGKPFNITVIQVYAPITDAEEAEVNWILWRPTRPSRTNIKKKSFSSEGIGIQK